MDDESERLPARLAKGMERGVAWLGDHVGFIKTGITATHRFIDEFGDALFDPTRTAPGRVTATFLICALALMMLAGVVTGFFPAVSCAALSTFAQTRCADQYSVSPWLSALGALAALLPSYVLGRIALNINSKVKTVECKMTPIAARRARVLVMGLSTWNWRIGDPSEMTAAHLKRTKGCSDEDIISSFCSPDVDRGPWQQAVRRIAPEIASDGLMQICVVPSRESAKEWDAFFAYVKSICGERVAEKLVREPETGIEYEQFGAVYGAIEGCVTKAMRLTHDLEPRDVCVDVTAGFKVFSVAAALVTLNRQLTFSYVTNNPSTDEQGEHVPKGSVRLYDARATFFRDVGETIKNLG